MKVDYASVKVESQCTSYKSALKLFGGNKALARSLLARINALEAAKTLKDIIIQPMFRFHNLKKKRKDLRGYFAIDVKTKKDAWRIILRPINENKMPYDHCQFDQIAARVEIVEIKEVSKHYE